MFHIGRAGTKLGVFSEFEVRQGLKSGRFLLTDLGWKEGMENWAPLSQFSEFTTPPEPMPPLPGEDAADEATPPPLQGLVPGLPWDFRKEIGFFKAFGQTAWMIISNPTDAFSRMLQTGKLINPLLFNLLGSWFGAICSGIYFLIQVKTQTQPPPNLGPLNAFVNFTPEFALEELKLFIFLGPVFVTLGALISAGIAHLFLMLAGGANKPFHVTLRVFCFTCGSVELMKVIPVAGNLLAPATLVVYCILGLAIAHETSHWRAVTAMALFLLAGFVCVMGMLFALLALAPAAGHS